MQPLDSVKKFVQRSDGALARLRAEGSSERPIDHAFFPRLLLGPSRISVG